MAVAASPSEEAEEALARWDGDGGSLPAKAPLPVEPRPVENDDAERFVRFIRLGGVAEVRDGEVSFPPGILRPYTSDLRRVRAAFDEAGGVATDSLLAAMATLYERIAFAPGPAGGAVADVYNETRKALSTAAGGSAPDRRCSRCRQTFPAGTPRPGPPEGWWLCPSCHDKLIGTGSRTVVGGPS